MPGMDLKNARIGLSLSGGGIRATIFHLGVLQYLAEAGLFDQIKSISSVSGASLCIGAIFAANNNKWPSGEGFLKSVQPKVRKFILDHDIQKSALRRLPFSPHLWWNRVELIAKMLEDKWGIKGTLQDLPQTPYWEVNCTTFETGKGFRFRRDFMGDHSVGYVQNPKLPLSHVIAASAGFPVLIGPYLLQTGGMRWTKDKWGREGEVSVDEQYTLWDGGIYDNLGIEALYKIRRGLDKEIDFLLVSNASASIAHKERHGNVSLNNLIRLLDIAMFQVESLHSREVLAAVMSKGNGMYMKIGNSAEKIAEDFRIPPMQSSLLVKSCLSEQEAAMARDYATTLNTPSQSDFDLIFRHGYENTKCVHLCREMAEYFI